MIVEFYEDRTWATCFGCVESIAGVACSHKFQSWKKLHFDFLAFPSMRKSEGMCKRCVLESKSYSTPSHNYTTRASIHVFRTKTEGILFPLQMSKETLRDGRSVHVWHASIPFLKCISALSNNSIARHLKQWGRPVNKIEFQDISTFLSSLHGILKSKENSVEDQIVVSMGSQPITIGPAPITRGSSMYPPKLLQLYQQHWQENIGRKTAGRVRIWQGPQHLSIADWLFFNPPVSAEDRQLLSNMAEVTNSINLTTDYRSPGLNKKLSLRNDCLGRWCNST